MWIAERLGSWHPALVHFPIALWIVAFFVDAAALIRRNESWGRVSLFLLLVGTAVAGFAGVSGVLAEIAQVRLGLSDEPAEYHERWAIISIGWFVGLCIVRLNAGPHSGGLARALVVAAFGLGVLIVGYTGHVGGELVTRYAAGVDGAVPRFHPTDETLQLLATRASMEGRQYSNLMHWAAGVMSLLLAVFLFVAQAVPRIQSGVIRVTPWLLILGGIGLFIFSDTDAFPLSDQRPAYKDTEVVFHKVIAFMMLGAGIAGVRKRKDPEAQTRSVGRAIGMLALAGGAILFTHIHAGTPYSDEAVGVYLQHMVLASVAIAIGMVKFFEDRPWAPWRVRAYAFPVLIGVEAILLLTYVEGMPWFTGRRWALREGPHAGLLQQLGNRRAELVFESPELHVYLYQLESDAPAPMAARVLQGRVRTYRETTGIELRSEDGAHFTATAGFLRKAKFFGLQVDTPEGSIEFEPWTLWKPGAPRTLPQTACPMNALADLQGAAVCPDCGRRTVAGTSPEYARSFADYICPEHPAIGYGSPVTCPLCGQWLQKNPQSMSSDVMIKFTVTPPNPMPGQPVKITACPEDKKTQTMVPVPKLRGHEVHLDIVGPRTCEHLHPERRPDT
jgi:uncharacterized membrane protein